MFRVSHLANRSILLFAERRMRKRAHSYSDEILMEALNAVKEGRLTKTEASREYHIPCSTMSDHLSGYIKSTAGRLGLVSDDVFTIMPVMHCECIYYYHIL